MNKPNKCKNCQWYGKPYWSVINPCDNCNREDYYKIMETYYTEDYVKSLLQKIEDNNSDINNLTYQLAKMKEENDVLKKKLDRRYYKNEYERIKEENERLKQEQEYNNYCDEQLRKKISNLEYKITTLEDYKSRCEKADNQLKIIMQIIKEQPTRNVEDDEWIENRLIGVVNILQNGSDSQ